MQEKRPRQIIVDNSDETGVLRQMGALFADELREDAERPDAPAAIKRDWFTVADWLGHTSGPLTAEQAKSVEEAWIAYWAMGVAPSGKLQDQFDHYSTELAGRRGTTPPKAVLDVFDRMLATDEEIRTKRSADTRREAQAFQRAAQALKGRPLREGARPEGGPSLRQAMFGTVVWGVAVFVYAWLFDPFDEGGWDRLDDEQFNKLFVICILPLVAFLLLKIYRKWVH